MSTLASLSRLYDCEVMHSRSNPVRHSFKYRYFCFCLDLDEVSELSTKSRLFGLQAWKLFRFAAEDYIFGARGNTPIEVKQNVIAYAKSKGIIAPIDRVELVAHMRTLGFSFNPAAFYFCYGEDGAVLCSILEVTNTYRERKTYFIPAGTREKGKIKGAQAKHFYVSPFVELDSDFEFDLEAPTETLSLAINSKREGATAVRAVVRGQAVVLSDSSLLTRLFKHAWITVAVIARIHYQAARLYFKKVPFIRKNDRPDLQKGGLS